MNMDWQATKNSKKYSLATLDTGINWWHSSSFHLMIWSISISQRVLRLWMA